MQPQRRPPLCQNCSVPCWARFMRLGLDALGYGLLSEGRMDIILEAGMKPCDVRALIPIVEGAGGK